LGDNGWVRHREAGVTYVLDVTRCMFSSGNTSERARMGRLNCSGETIVDLFAGIGYFTIPLLARAGGHCSLQKSDSLSH
jgi:tRNA wybutosine-synthesizing protein 3